MTQDFDASILVQTAGDAIIAADPAGTIIFWNPAATRIFGYTESQALGQSLDLIIPQQLRQAHWDGYRKTMQTGETRYGSEVLRVPAVHKDGSKLSIAFTVTLMQSPETQERIIAAIIRDETARWNEERELRKRLAELEAKQG